MRAIVHGVIPMSRNLCYTTRMRILSIDEISRALHVLGIDFEARMSHHRVQEDAFREFESMKKDAKKNYKRLAMFHHPDRGGDEQKFKELVEAHTMISRCKVGPPPEPPPTTVVWVGFASGGSVTSSTSSTSTFW